MGQGKEGDLELEDAMPYHRREWRISNLAWVLFLLTLLAALAGLLGPGPLGKRIIASEETGLRIEYHRYLRVHREAELTITARHSTNGEVKLALGREFSRRTSIQGIVPEPENSASGSDHLLLNVKTTGGASEIKIEFEPTHVGTLSFAVQQEGKSPIQVRMFVYP